MMNNFSELLKNNSANTLSVPVIFRLSQQDDQEALQKLFQTGAVRHVVDDYREQHHELFGVHNPSMVYTPGFQDSFEKYYAALGSEQELWQQGNWVYFPWISTLVHILEEEDFFVVRTARNRNLISEAEQKKFYHSVIGIGGLSVGNSVALVIVLQGGARHIKIADHDRLALSNTNRIRTGVESLGLPKTLLAARQIYTINPYAQVELFGDGITADNIDAFFVGSSKLDLVIDELDTMGIKLKIREKAKQYKVPVVMGADNGDNIIVDIERYDLSDSIKPFQGRLGDITYEELASLDKFGIGRTITKFLGPENITERMQQSLLEMGKTIVSWPQLGGAALLNGVAVAYCVRKILNGEELADDRVIVSMDEMFIPSYNAPENKKHRAEVSDGFKKMFNL